MSVLSVKLKEILYHQIHKLCKIYSEKTLDTGKFKTL